MMSVRTSFVEHFGEAMAEKVMAAAESHKNGIHDRQGSDPFQWALCICIGYRCFTANAHYHDLTALDSQAVQQWCREHGHLDTHDGDVDYLALFADMYDDWMPEHST